MVAFAFSNIGQVAFKIIGEIILFTLLHKC